MGQVTFSTLMLFVLSVAFGCSARPMRSALANVASGLIPAVGVLAAHNQNVVNGIFYAFLVAVVGLAIVAVGGGIAPMRGRREAALARYDEEKPKMAEQVRNAPPRKDQTRHTPDVAQEQAEMNSGGQQATRHQPPRQDPPRPTMASPDTRQGPGTHRS